MITDKEKAHLLAMFAVYQHAKGKDREKLRLKIMAMVKQLNEK